MCILKYRPLQAIFTLAKLGVCVSSSAMSKRKEALTETERENWNSYAEGKGIIRRNG